ncbi:hypothetical protein [Streptomyces sp. NPDC101455]|uniref:hypothetical protein n=1 Tax=Streptomyces sp. NPDC101455 TaxID=3366142 RepID=UPI00380AECE0
MNASEQPESEGDEPLHHNDSGTSPREGYRYGADGIGVRADLVQAVIDAWARISLTGDPASPLHSVNNGAIYSVDNLARLAATAVADTIGSHRQGSRARTVGH